MPVEMASKTREFMLIYNVQRQLGQSEDWIFWVSLVTRMFDESSFPAIFSGIGRHFKLCWYQILVITEANIYLLTVDAVYLSTSFA